MGTAIFGVKIFPAALSAAAEWWMNEGFWGCSAESH
jgi:hypothetical protein